jgi:hypothetical protein
VRAQKPKGSIVFNRTRSTWNFLWVENGSRKSRKLGALTELPTRSMHCGRLRPSAEVETRS